MVLKCRRESWMKENTTTLTNIGKMTIIHFITRTSVVTTTQSTLPSLFSNLVLLDNLPFQMIDLKVEHHSSQEELNSCNIEECQLMTTKVWMSIWMKRIQTVRESEFQHLTTFNFMTCKKHLLLKDLSKWRSTIHCNTYSRKILPKMINSWTTNNKIYLLLSSMQASKISSSWSLFQLQKEKSCSDFKTSLTP